MAARSPVCGSTSATHTRAPRAASASAYARPRPRPAPVTTATLPASECLLPVTISQPATVDIERGPGNAAGSVTEQEAHCLGNLLGSHDRSFRYAPRRRTGRQHARQDGGGQNCADGRDADAAW